MSALFSSASESASQLSTSGLGWLFSEPSRVGFIDLLAVLLRVLDGAEVVFVDVVVEVVVDELLSSSLELQPTSTVPRAAPRQSVATCLRAPNGLRAGGFDSGSNEGKFIVLSLLTQPADVKD